MGCRISQEELNDHLCNMFRKSCDGKPIQLQESDIVARKEARWSEVRKTMASKEQERIELVRRFLQRRTDPVIMQLKFAAFVMKSKVPSKLLHTGSMTDVVPEAWGQFLRDGMIVPPGYEIETLLPSLLNPAISATYRLKVSTDAADPKPFKVLQGDIVIATGLTAFHCIERFDQVLATRVQATDEDVPVLRPTIAWCQNREKMNARMGRMINKCTFKVGQRVQVKGPDPKEVFPGAVAGTFLGKQYLIEYDDGELEEHVREKSPC